MTDQVNLANEPDIMWIIALWFAIHGGDPNPEGGVHEVSEETYALANALVENLQATYSRFGARALPKAELEERLVKSTGVITYPGEFTLKPPPQEGGGTGGQGSITVGPNCFRGPGGPTYCYSTTSRSIETGH